MKKAPTFLKMLFAVVLIAISLSCSKDDDEELKVTDPAIGTWNLRAIYDGGQAVDVTERACFRDSRLTINESTMNLTLSVPNEDASGCQTETLQSDWINEDGTYYLIDGNERQQANIVLNDDNQTLQMTIMAGGEQVALLFRK
ncbi:lipocalin family protein [Olivibacter sp. XZL3]|uniref:lipocalin family protein n=1 Tax=Olivibacter sp. XZL3 TaxID=1735116 RepID=UPI001064F203|nr:lipocalin family protein [Olivibacter sp. XZL3]